MKKTTPVWNAACMAVQPVRNVWQAAQTQWVDTLNWSADQAVQARYWLSATHCSASEYAKRLLAVVSPK